MRDQDAGDCHVIKAGLVTRCRAGGQPAALVRIACRELESWYLADLTAVESALKVSGLAAKQHKRNYRAPDRLPSPSHELQKLTRGLYQKISGSRAIGLHLDPENRRSNSFRVFVEGIRRLVTANGT